MSEPDAAVHMEHVSTRFGTKVVHDDINLTIRRGERVGLVGGSGSGKTTLLREMIGLQRPTKGSITVLGQPLYRSSRTAEADMLRRCCGVLFQFGALFTDLNVYDNVALPIRELRSFDESLVRELVFMKLRLVGLAPDVARLMPYELSGGMTKRAGLARALALEPELLFLDEPTSGLDPVGSDNFVRVISRLHADLGFTMVLVTHDLETLSELCDRVAVLSKGRLAAVGSLDEVKASKDPSVRALFHVGDQHESTADRADAIGADWAGAEERGHA
jgi:phospholipid/cholesterol/gamma-HCH transport system ATP-binding protein